MKPTQEEIVKGEFSANFSLLEHPNKSFVNLIKKAIKEESPIDHININGKEKYLAFVPISSTNWSVGVVVPIGEVLVPVRDAILVALMVTILIAVATSLFTGKRIAQPLRKLSEVSSKIIGGDLTARLALKTPIEEFHEVGKDINLMVDSLQSNIEKLKQALGSYSKVLSEVALGDLSARVDTGRLKEEYKLLGETLNSIVTILGYDTEGLKKGEAELREALALYGYTLEKIVDEGDLSVRIDTDKLGGKHKLIGTDINLLIGGLQAKMEESKKREDELKEERVFFQQILTSIPDILVVTDNEDHWLQVSPSFEEVTGFKIEEVLGKKTAEQQVYKDLPEGIELNKQMWERVCKGEVVHGLEIPWRTKEGKKIILSASERTLRDSKGKDIGRVFVAREIAN
jgi:PAS domain S-box-containing protein